MYVPYVLKLRSELSKKPSTVDVRELPVIFKSNVVDDRTVWNEYTSNFVNCLVVGDKAIMPKSHGLTTIPGQDWFETIVNVQMSGTIESVFVDSWALHLQKGEVHCGSNVRREPIKEKNWWNCWEEYKK